MATRCTNLEQKKNDVKGMCMGDMKEYEVIDCEELKKNGNYRQ